MERTALTFPTIANLFLFMDSVVTIHLSVVPKANIVKGLFTESQINAAVTQFGATWIKHEEPMSHQAGVANEHLLNKKTGGPARHATTDIFYSLVSVVKQWTLLQSPYTFFTPL